MPHAHVIKTAFNAGEWSPIMEGRVDLEKYGMACRQLQNYLITPQGPIVSRPGTQYIATAKSSATNVYLRPFIFSNTQAYVLEFGQYYLRFYKDGAQIESGDLPYELATPWPASKIPSLQFAQTGDVMYIAHPDYPAYKLTRYDHASWNLSAITWTDGPYIDMAPDSIKYITPSATSGTGISLTASYNGSYTQFGTYGGTLGTPEAVLTTTRQFLAYLFEAPTQGKIHTVKLNIITASAAADLATAYLYASDGAKATGSPLATSDTQDFNVTGEKTFTFSTAYEMTADADYAIIIDIATPDDLITIDVVTDDTDYVSGYAATATGAVTPLSSLDWRIEVEYQPTGLAELFEAGHVGSLWRLRHTGKSVQRKMDAVGEYTASDIFYGAFNVDLTPSPSDGWVGRAVLEQSKNRVSWFSIAEFHSSTRQSFFETEPNMYYRCRITGRQNGIATLTISQAETWGVVRITAVTDGSHAVGDVVVKLGAVSATPFFREGAFSAKRGYPRGLMLHDDRLCFFGTSYQPYTMWRSWSGDYENFIPGGDTDASADTFTLSALSNGIQWIRPALNPILGTIGEEARLVVQKSEPMSASNPPTLDIQSTEGSAQNIVPIKIGPVLVFADRSRLKLLELAYSLETDSVTPSDLTLFAPSIMTGGIIELAYAAKPHSNLVCVRSDGVLPCLTLYRRESVMGWSRIVSDGLDGVIESVCSIPSSLGDTAGHDEIWMVVARTVGETTTRFIERMADNSTASSLTDFVCLDCAVVYSGAADTVFTGYDHLEGEDVSVCADGRYIGEFTVTGGAITLEEAASNVCGGLLYTCICEPVPLEAGLVPGTAQGLTKKITEVTVRLLDTVGGKIGPSEAKLHPIPLTSLGDDPLALKSGDYHIPWHGQWEQEGRVLIVQDEPYPMTILAAIITVTTNG